MILSEIPLSRRAWTQFTAEDFATLASDSGRTEASEGFETSNTEGGDEALGDFSDAFRAIRNDTVTMFSVIERARRSLSFIKKRLENFQTSGCSIDGSKL